MILRADTRTMATLLAQWFLLAFCIQSAAGNACSSSPCEGGGTCIPDYNNNYYCQCPADSTGDNCQHCRIDQAKMVLFPEINEGTQTITTAHHLFTGLMTPHKGYLTGVTFYARQAGTFWLDLYKKNGSESYTLVFSRSFTVTTVGQNNVDIYPSVGIEQRVTLGVHSSLGLADPLAVTVSADQGYLVWRTLLEEGDFEVGNTTVTASDNTDSEPVYMVPSLLIHVQQPNLITWYPSCTAEQQLQVIDRPLYISLRGQIFVGLTTLCAGWLHAISIHVRVPGTIYIDLWKEVDAGTDYVLVYTRKITVTLSGMFTVLVEEVVYVEEGLVYGTHRPESDISTSVLENGQTNANQPTYSTKIYEESHEDATWTPNVLRFSHLTHRSNDPRAPSIAIHIRNTTSDVQPSLPLYIENPVPIGWFPGCSLQQEYEVIDRSYQPECANIYWPPNTVLWSPGCH